MWWLRGCNSKPLAFGWLTRAHLQLRIPRHCSGSLGQPSSNRTGEQMQLGAQPLAAVKLPCPISVRLQKGEPANTVSPHNSQPFLIKRTHAAVIDFSINKTCLAIVPFWFLGNRDVAGEGGLTRTQHYVQQYYTGKWLCAQLAGFFQS